MNYWKKAEEELKYAQQAREFENEGMARVCARRSAGWAIKGFLADHSLTIPSPTALSLLQDEEIRELFPVNIRNILSHLSQRVSLETGLDGIDLLADTEELLKYLKISSSKENLNVGKSE